MEATKTGAASSSGELLSNKLFFFLNVCLDLLNEVAKPPRETKKANQYHDR